MPIPVEEETAILKAWNQHQNWSVGRIARHVGCEARAVRRILGSAQVDSSTRKPKLDRQRKNRDDQVRKDLADLAEGRGRHRSMADIGRTHGITREWVRRLASQR